MGEDEQRRHDRRRGARTPAHARSVHERRWPRVAGLALVGALAAGASGAAALASQVGTNVTTVGSVADVLAEAAGEQTDQAPDPWDGRAVDLLLLGSDDRSGENAAIGGAEDGMRADTTLLAHVSADRTRIEITSLPRDTRARIPACPVDTAGGMSSPREDKFNAAFATGALSGDVGLAAACTALTVREMTGVEVDAFMIVDFAGFQGMVDAVGGVEVCVPEPLVDGRYTALNLPAGRHVLLGQQALDYVRARHVEGTDGTDLSRIERQQNFLGALVRKVTGSDVLTSPAATLSFVDAATSSLTVSSELSGSQVMGLVWSMRELRPQDVTFVTVPWRYDAQGWVEWTSEADVLWQRLLADQPLVPPAPEPTATATGAPGGPGGDGTADDPVDDGTPDDGTADDGATDDGTVDDGTTDGTAPQAPAPPVLGTTTAVDTDAAVCG